MFSGGDFGKKFIHKCGNAKFPEDISTAVLSMGCGTTKIGYAGQDTPTGWFPTLAGQNHLESPAKRGKANYTFNIQDRQDNVQLLSPIDSKGLVSDWDLAEALLDHAFEGYLKTSPGDHPLLLAEPLMTAKADRERWCEILFEKHKCPGVFMMKEGVLSLFAHGKTSGLVVDLGEGGTTITPVQDGYTLMMGAKRLPIGGRVMDQYYSDLLEAKEVEIRPTWSVRKHVQVTTAAEAEAAAAAMAGMDTTMVDGPTPNIATSGDSGAGGGGLEALAQDGSGTSGASTTAFLAGGQQNAKLFDFPLTHPSYRLWSRLEVIRELKESVCRVSETVFDEEANANIPHVPYELPDGTILPVDADRFRVPELLFDPTPLAATHLGVRPLPDEIMSSVIACDFEVRKDLMNQLILTGGGSCATGMVERLQKEETKPRILTGSGNERKLSTFVGGSILGSLGSFHDMYFAAGEYLERGASYIHEKCP